MFGLKAWNTQFQLVFGRGVIWQAFGAYIPYKLERLEAYHARIREDTTWTTHKPMTQRLEEIGLFLIRELDSWRRFGRGCKNKFEEWLAVSRQMAPSFRWRAKDMSHACDKEWYGQSCRVTVPATLSMTDTIQEKPGWFVRPSRCFIHRPLRIRLVSILNIEYKLVPIRKHFRMACS